jgi:tetratricopeptide (TPR) repeat protein
LGQALGQLGRWEEAVVEYGRVLEVNPKSAVVRHQLGYALMRLERWKEAEIELRKAAELHPGSVVVWQQLGDVLRELGRRGEAVEVDRRALEIELGFAKSKNALKKLVLGESDNNVDRKKSSVEDDNELLPKTLHSGLPEFGYELISVLPYAYHLHEQKKLKQTISGNDTRSLYFFSPSHVEVKEKRSWSNTQKPQVSRLPNINIHQGQLDWSLFSPPPINEYYQDTAIRFSKPTLVICNRYNYEWAGEPINYINRKTLRQLFEMFHKDYQIVYVNQIFFGVEYEDDAKPMELDEMTIVSDFSGYVITLLDIIKLYPQSSINELQCRIYAGCDRFISSNGGFGILCSYFGGENVIFSKMCCELDPSVNSFNAWYPRLSKATISVVKAESKLIDICKRKWLEDTPLFNIIIRTSGRPNYFHDCMRSIYEQSHKNVNVIVGIDDQKSLSYVQGHICTVVPLQKYTGQPQPPPRKSEEYGVWFPYNNYFTKLLEYARIGYVIYLEDEDCFASKNSLAELASKIIETKAELIFWRVLSPNRVIPSDANWEKQIPVNGDMSGLGFSHVTTVVATWEPWKRGDYRVAKHLNENIQKQLWFDKIIVKTQRKEAGGYEKKDDKPFIHLNLNPPMVVIIAAYKFNEYLEECLDSIVNQVIPKKCPSRRILVGVDSCTKNRKLARKYAPNVEFYFTEQGYFGRYMMKNSLLLKVWRRDSLVLFFDADNIMPPGFLNSYYLKFRDLQSQKMSDNSGECPSLDIIMHARFIGIFQELIEKAKSYNNLPLTESISILQSIFVDSGKVGSDAQVRQSAKSDGVFFTLYSTLERLGFFFTSREGQDSDLFLRAKAMKINNYYDNGLPYFIKRIYGSSLVDSSGEENSEYREKVQEETQKRLTKGNYVADKKAITMKLLR